MCTKISISNALVAYTYYYTYIPKSVKTRQLTSRFLTVAWPSGPGSNSLNLSHNVLVGMFDYLKFSYDNAEIPRELRKRRLWSFVLLSGTNTSRKSRIWTSYMNKNSLAQYRPGGKSCIINKPRWQSKLVCPPTRFLTTGAFFELPLEELCTQLCSN